jgi:hypothetical protein
MSAPQTDPEKQFRRHPVPLIGMGVLCVLVLIGFIWWLGYETDAPAVSPEVERQLENAPAIDPSVPAGTGSGAPAGSNTPPSTGSTSPAPQ